MMIITMTQLFMRMTGVISLAIRVAIEVNALTSQVDDLSCVWVKRRECEVVVDELPDLHDHVREIFGGIVDIRVHGVGNLPGIREGISTLGHPRGTHAVSVRRSQQPPHAHISASPARILKVVASAVGLPVLLRGVAHHVGLLAHIFNLGVDQTGASKAFHFLAGFFWGAFETVAQMGRAC